MISMNFNEIKNQEQLKVFFGITAEQLNYLLVPIYKSFVIPKKNGGYRKINKPHEDLLYFQKIISWELNKIYTPLAPTFVFGYLKKSNNKELYIKTNAKEHLGSNFVVNVDIKDFFNSIHFNTVLKLFSSELFQLDIEAAKILTSLVTHKQSLVIGSPASPVISNLIFLEIDKVLYHFSKAFEGNYTRYADDLTFSFESKPKKDFIISIQQQLSKYGFYLNQNKINISGKNYRQEVNGLTINNFVNISKEYLKNFRATLHNFKNNDFQLEFDKYTKSNHTKYLKFKKNNLKRFYGVDVEVNLANYEDNLYFKKRFIEYSLRGKLIFIGKILGTNHSKFVSFSRSFKNLADILHQREESPILKREVAYITNSTANSVVYYSYIFLRNERFSNEEIKSFVYEFSTNGAPDKEKILKGLNYESISFIKLYGAMTDNSRFESLINRKIDEGKIKEIIKNWKGKELFFKNYSRKIFHTNLQCNLIRNDFDEPNEFHPNTGVFAYTDENKPKAPIYEISRLFLETMGMRVCKKCLDQIPFISNLEDWDLP